MRPGGLSSVAVDEPPILVGSSDIAAVLGVSRQAVDHRLRTDPRAPVPAATVNRTARWGGTQVRWRVEVDRWLGGPEAASAFPSTLSRPLAGALRGRGTTVWESVRRVWGVTRGCLRGA